MPATAAKKVSLRTKADEVAHLQDFVDALPGCSYLRSCLEPFVPEFERDVYSDFVPSFAESWAHRTEARHEAGEAAKELKALQDQCKAVKAEIAKHVDSLRKAQHALHSLQNCLGLASASADAAVEKAERLL